MWKQRVASFLEGSAPGTRNDIEIYKAKLRTEFGYSTPAMKL